MLTKRRRRTLGKSIRIYRAKSFSRGDFFRWFLPGLLLPLGLLSYGIWLSDLENLRLGSLNGTYYGQPWFLLAAIALIPVTLYMLRHVRSWKMGVALNANGLRFQRLSSQHDHLFWSQITGIATRSTRYHFFGLTLTEQLVAVLYPTTGKAIYLPANLEDLEDLVEQIKTRLYPLLEPQLIQRLNKGKWLHFGPFHINQKGMRYARHTPAWDQVEDIQVRSGRLWVRYGKRARIRIDCEKIPNLELMLNLIDSNIQVMA